MINLLTPVHVAQLLSILLVIPAIYMGFKRSKVDFFLLSIIFVTTCFFGKYNLAELIETLDKIFPFISSIWASVRNFEPSLIANVEVLVAWLNMVFGAVVTWGFLLFIIFYNTNQRVIRGTKIKTKEEMTRLLKKHGKIKTPVKIGQYTIPQRLETRPIGLYGEPGSGKTQILLRILKAVVLRKDRAVVVDVNGEIYEKVGGLGDLILSATHEGSVNFCPIAEIQVSTDCEMVANAFISEGVGENKSWNGYARTLFAIFLRWCWEHDRTQNKHLIYFIKRAPIDELERLCRDTSAQRLFEKGSEKMLSNVMSILSQNLTCLELLDPAADKNAFSIRRWVTSESNYSQKLWIIYDEFSAAATLPLRTAWIEILIRESLNLKPDAVRRLWCLIDEVASIGKVESLSQAVSRGRKYGLIPIVAVQNLSMLYSIYGRDEAISILGSIGHILVLRTPEPDTADYLSRAIGDKEILRKQVNHSKNGDSSQNIIETKRAVLPSEISSLPDLNGYIKFAGVGWAKVKIPLLKLPNKNVLTPKKIDNSLLEQFDENEVSTTSNLSFDEV
ncbi:MAG: type IV secretion system DNA-binding domain-containing protein [Colwellia sp.]